MAEREKQVPIYVRGDVAKLLKVVAILEGRPQSEIANQAISNFLLGRVQEYGIVQEVDELVSGIVEKIRARVTLPPDLT